MPDLMQDVFKKYFWVLQGLGLAVATGLAASAVTTQFGTSIVLDVSADEEAPVTDDEDVEEDDDSPPTFRRSSTSKSNGVAKQRTATAIQERNIFCPTCMPEAEVPELELDENGRPIGISPGEVKSSLNLRIMATMESERPEFSLATVRDDDSGTAGLYGVGDAVRAGVTVLGIDRGIVHLRNNGRLEYLELFDEGRPPPSRPERPEPPPSSSRSSASVDGAEDSIKCPSDNLCIVERDFVDKLMANPAQLARQARVVPSQKDGETQGYKFYGIRRGSLPKLLGIKNGDLITEINGESLGGDMNKVIGMLTKLRTASNLSVTLTRRGETMTKEIQIQ